jgi:hypothetical protein
MNDFKLLPFVLSLSKDSDGVFQQPVSTTVLLTSIDHVAVWASIELSHDGASQDMAQRSDGIGHVTLCALGCRAGCNLGVGKPLLIERSFF